MLPWGETGSREQGHPHTGAHRPLTDPRMKPNGGVVEGCIPGGDALKRFGAFKDGNEGRKGTYFLGVRPLNGRERRRRTHLSPCPATFSKAINELQQTWLHGKKSSESLFITKFVYNKVDNSGKLATTYMLINRGLIK